jgi:dephospho-CoA kinase
MLTIGLTGPIGCGKSTVAGWLAGRGAVVIDADEVARAVSAPGEPGHDAVLEAFGDAVRVDAGRRIDRRGQQHGRDQHVAIGGRRVLAALRARRDGGGAAAPRRRRK